LNPVLRLKGALRQAAGESRYSREQLAERMNRQAVLEGLGGRRGAKITVAALDGWLAESKPTVIPLELMPLFCWAVESLLPLRVLAACLGAEVITGEERVLLELARVEQETKRLARRKARLVNQIENK